MFSAQGIHTLEYWSVDNADNTEAHHMLGATIDTVPPTVSVDQSPLPNSQGWNNTPVTVTFTCSDAVSGVAMCPTPVTVSTQGADQPVAGTGFDNAGNQASASTTVSVDETAPDISGSASPTANANGWNNSDVVVGFSCSDALSGVASCTAPQTLSGEGAGQSASGTAVDLAGNQSTTSVGSINIDRTPPSVSVAGVTNGATYQDGSWSAACSTSDALSGVATQATLATSWWPDGDCYPYLRGRRRSRGQRPKRPC